MEKENTGNFSDLLGLSERDHILIVKGEQKVIETRLTFIERDIHDLKADVAAIRSEIALHNRWLIGTLIAIASVAIAILKFT